MSDKILNSFDTWINAQGLKSKGRVKSVDNISLEGIARLRELILELAIRGKLVPQNPEDEPARVLLEKIVAEEDKLIEEGKLKKKKPLPDISDSEKPFELPSTWEWVRLYQILSISSGDGLTASKMNSNGKIPVYGGNGVTGYHDSGNIKKPTLVIGRVGYYCGSVHITPDTAWVTDNAFITTFSEANFDINFLYWLLSATNLKERDSATAQPVISGRKIYPITIAIPPLEEQKRIVSKIEELMALCDELEQQEINHLKSHQLLVETLLATLTNAANAEELTQSWSRLEAYFDDLFTTEDSIDQLKQTILQLAVMGKLVPQNLADESASELLKKIAVEKEKLIEEGKLKKQKPLPEISSEEKPFELPDGWEWVRLGNITNKIGSGSTPRGGKESYVERGHLFLRSQNIYNHGLLLDDVAFIDDKTHEKMSNTKVLQDDILLNITGGSLGRVALFPGDLGEANVSQHVSIIRPTNPLTKYYLHLWLLAPCGQKLIWGRQVGANREGLSKKVLELFEVPLPPLQEQHRILEKVNELFEVCDSLSDSIKQNQEVANNLANTVLNFVD